MPRLGSSTRQGLLCTNGTVANSIPQHLPRLRREANLISETLADLWPHVKALDERVTLMTYVRTKLGY